MLSVGVPGSQAMGPPRDPVSGAFYERDGDVLMSSDSPVEVQADVCIPEVVCVSVFGV